MATMTCILCGRKLRAASAWTLGKPIGPVCARRRGMKEDRRTGRSSKAAPQVSSNQLPLDLQQ